jgi:hypothetical protein
MGAPRSKGRGRTGVGPLAAVVGGVALAFVLIWLVGIVVSAFVFAVRLVVIAAVLVGALWLWGKIKRR